MAATSRPRSRSLARSPRSRCPSSRTRCCGSPSAAGAALLVQVTRAMGELRSPRFLPVLLGLLAQREVRAEARTALVAHGPEGLAFLAEALSDEALPLELRRHLPAHRRALRSRAGGGGASAPAAAGARGRPALPDAAGPQPDRGVVRRGARRRSCSREATRATAEGVFRVLHWRGVLESGARELPARATPGHELLVQLLKDKEAQAIERLLRLLALQHRGEDFRDIYRGLRSRDARQRASSRELLENLLRPPLRNPILAIVERGLRPGAARRRGRALPAAPARLPGGARADPRRGRRVAALHRGPPHRRARPRRAAPAARDARRGRDRVLPLARARAHARGAVAAPRGRSDA